MLVSVWVGTLLVIVVLGALIALMYHKLSLMISQVSPRNQAEAHKLFQQVEALMALQTELKLERSLPPTRGWAASPDFLRNLAVHARSVRPQTIVECSSGVSTLILARCVQLNGSGHVYSLEHEAEYAEKTRANLRQHGLEAFATVLDAPLKPTSIPGWQGDWYEHSVLPADLGIDLLVVDGPPGTTTEQARYPAIPVLHDRFNANAAVFLDDAARPDEVTAVARWLGSYQDLALLQVPECEKGCVALHKR